MINTFRDLLLTTHFDYFRNLISQLDEMKAEFKKQCRQKKPPLDALISYRKIIPIASTLAKVFKGKRHSRETSIILFSDALIKLNLLIRELQEYGCNALANTFQHIYNRLFILLPKNTTIQHPLFDTECYQNESKKSCKTKGFIQWLQNYRLFGYMRRDNQQKRDRRLHVLDIVQPSLRLR